MFSDPMCNLSQVVCEIAPARVVDNRPSDSVSRFTEHVMFCSILPLFQ